MKIYNALSKSFTDEVKTIMGGGKSIDDAFEEVKMSIFGWDLSPTPTPEPIDINELLTQGDGEENGYHYVDLGLSVKWATCNVGADKVTDPGLLFQWGRVDGYRYGDENHKFRTNEQNAQDTSNQYIPKTATGATYDKGATLGSDDDAAHVNMGGNWRMPTCSYNQDIDQYEGEWSELINNTEKSVVTVNDVNGMLFTSNKNGHQLFIPFMQGFWKGNSFHASRFSAWVWSSQVYSSNDYNAYLLYCSFDGNLNAHYSNIRTAACAVRGVFK